MKTGFTFIFIILLSVLCVNETNRTESIAPGVEITDTIFSTEFYSRGSNTVSLSMAGNLSCREKFIRSKKVTDQMEPSGQAETMFPGACSRDSLFISRLVHNRAMISGLDLNEPAMRNFLFFTGDTSCFPSMITLSRESFLRIGFDNDILDYTDRFYTNGIRFDIILPLFSRNPINRLLIPHRGSGNNYYGISLVQNMYTPSSTKTGGISYNDRPYAAYLYVGSFKVTNVAIHYFRQTSGLLLGIIGPGSYGGWVQRSFHNSVPTNNEPLGWEYQIKNDFLINYDVAIEKGVINKKHIDLRLISTAAAGSLYTNLSGGFQVRAGWMNPYFANLGMARTGELMKMQLRKFQCYLFIGGACKLIGYDATLQGGMFNRTSPYTLTADQISRAVFQSSAGITFNYRGFRLDIEQFILSPEFKKGWWHKWVHIGLAFCL